ncbi:MAG: hypothetical protein JXB04_04755 [Kiritimatiellae bacterium]|nr:hypothetical protein [Kiritimatiellia bacterium]
MTARAHKLLALLLLAASPLAGGLARGLDPAFFEFPPLTRYVDHAPLSWPVFLLFAVLELAAVALLLRPRWFGFRPGPGSPDPASHVTPHGSRMPFWGWAGLVLNAVSWVFAWSRFEWLGFFREHTFFTLWLGYILFVDALVFRRDGQSILSRSPRTFVLLFPASAVAWWYFEYLNRFMQNWCYTGATSFTARHYLAYGTLCFSTVLPAVFETRDALAGLRWFRTAYRRGPALRPWGARRIAGAMAVGVASLFLLGFLPGPMFFLTWLGPLAILAGSLALAGEETPFSTIRRGDYSELVTLAVAALVCGFFWEMWNYWTLPKWHYAVPYVGTWSLFEMPVVGFTGYLPFGPICLCFWQVFRGALAARSR